MRTRILRLLMRSAECRDGLPVSSMSRRGRKAIRCLFANSVLGAVGRGSDYFSSSEILQKNTNIFLHGYYSSNTLYVKKRFSLVTRFKTKHRIFFFFFNFVSSFIASFWENYLVIRHHNPSNMVVSSSPVMMLIAYIFRAFNL